MAEQARGLNELMARYHLASAAGAVPPRREPAPRASKATAAATKTPERRGAGRPWTTAKADPAVKTEAGPAGARARAAAGGAQDAEWKEF